MSDVRVSLTLTPAEFDLLRSALDADREVNFQASRNRDLHGGQMQKHRQRTVQLDDLIKKLS